MTKSDSTWTFWWLPDWRTLLSGCLIILCFSPFHLWWLTWISLIPWLLALERRKTLSSRLAQGFWLSYFMSVGVCYWMAFAIKEFGNLPWAVGILGLQVFALLGQPQFPAFAGLFHFQLNGIKVKSDPSKMMGWTAVAWIAFMAISYSATDWIIPKLFLNTLGHTLTRAKAIRQLAEIGGVWMLTTLIAFVNLAIWLLWRNRREIFTRSAGTLKATGPLIAATLLLVAGGWLYGHSRQIAIENAMAAAPRGIQTAVIQGNIGNFEKLASEHGIEDAANHIIDTFVSLSNQALSLKPKPEVLVWPETAYPAAFGKARSAFEKQLENRVKKVVADHHIPLLFGGYDLQNGKLYNALFHLDPTGKLQVYHKSILLMFGEYFPGADTFTFLRDWFPQVANFGRGAGPEVLSVDIQSGKSGRVGMGPVICYEGLFPKYLLDSARNGSEMILNVTNDSWFGPWGQPGIHLTGTIFRSIETRLPQLRATNTGISALIMPDGEVVSPTAIGVPTIMNVQVPLTGYIPTLMKAWGDWYPPFALLITAMGLAIFMWKNHAARVAKQDSRSEDSEGIAPGLINS